MLQTFFVLFFVIVGASIPIIFWGYLFSYFDNNKLNRSKFLFGIFAGIASVFPVLFLKEFSQEFQKWNINIFSYIGNFSFDKNFVWFVASFLLLLLIVSIFPFFLNLKNNFKKRSELFGKSLLIFTGYFLLLSVFFLLLHGGFSLFPLFDFEIDTKLSVGEVVFNSLKLVIFYYIILALVEELSKFFCFKFSSYFQLISLKQGILFSMFVALGFAFFENILYFYTLYEDQGFSQSLIAVYISRNIFSVILHVLCSSVFGYFFTSAYLTFSSYKNIGLIKKMLYGFLIALFLHAFFNIFLTLDIMIGVFFYLIGAYFYLTYILQEHQDI